MSDLSLKHKILKSLYQMGLKNFGPDLLTELKVGSPSWNELASGLLEGNDHESRKLVLRQIMGKNVLERSQSRKKLTAILLDYLSRGLGEEKRLVLRFIKDNLHLFDKDDDAFKAKIFSLTRDTDSKINQPALALLGKLGMNMDDPSLYRNR